MSDTNSTRYTFALNIAVILTVFAIFAIILAIAYLPQRSTLPTYSTSDTTPEQRAATLAEVRAREKSAATTYGWIDQPKGIMRLPIDRAIELTIRDLNAQRAKERASAVAQTSSLPNRPNAIDPKAGWKPALLTPPK